MDRKNDEPFNNPPALAEFLQSSEPLSDEKIDYILNYKGETPYIDFKVALNTAEQREWLEIIKDVMAFANTNGGYLVFGIKDKTFEKIGIEEKDWKTLVDPDEIQKKANAYILPPITSLITVHKVIGGKNFVLVCVPESQGKTHIVVKEGKFKNDKENKDVIILRKGTIYVRRSGCSILIEPSDLDVIIEKRIKYYKDTLHKNIAKVIEAPGEREVLIFDPNAEEISTGGRKFVLSNDPYAIPIKGISTTVTPQTDEDEIATIIAAFRKDTGHLPAKGLLYRIYAKRDQIGLSKDYFKDIGLISIYRDVPCFYWLQFLFKKEVEEILDEVFEEKGNFFAKAITLKIAACFGKSYFNKYFKRANDPRHEWMERKYKQSGCDALFPSYELGKTYTIEQMEKEAIELTLTLSQAKSKHRIMDNDKLWSIDYRLYAQYITKKAET